MHANGPLVMMEGCNVSVNVFNTISSFAKYYLVNGNWFIDIDRYSNGFSWDRVRRFSCEKPRACVQIHRAPSSVLLQGLLNVHLKGPDGWLFLGWCRIQLWLKSFLFLNRIVAVRWTSGFFPSSFLSVTVNVCIAHVAKVHVSLLWGLSAHRTGLRPIVWTQGTAWRKILCAESVPKDGPGRWGETQSVHVWACMCVLLCPSVLAPTYLYRTSACSTITALGGQRTPSLPMSVTMQRKVTMVLTAVTATYVYKSGALL